MWHLPLAALNQLVIFDAIANGAKPRWLDSGKKGAQDLDALLADALTGGL